MSFSSLTELEALFNQRQRAAESQRDAVYLTSSAITPVLLARRRRALDALFCSRYTVHSSEGERSRRTSNTASSSVAVSPAASRRAMR